MKTCFKCNSEKPLSEYYAHKRTKDGHSNKCKDCTKSDVRNYRRENETVRAYDRARGTRRTLADIQKYRAENPNKYKAHTKVNNAIRDGKLKRGTCEECGEKAHAHHDDYSKPLDIRWLCPLHHQRWHAKNGEALNPH